MSNSSCELCSSESNVTQYEVSGMDGGAYPSAAALCSACLTQVDGADEALNVNHWRCLNSSIWSENPAVKVIAWRMLNRLSVEGWAQDLLEQLYLDDDLLSLAQAGVPSTSADLDEDAVAKDSNGTVLVEGDAVTLIKDLDVKGANFTAKRGTIVKKITLTGDPALVEGKVNGTQIVLKTCFLKKMI